MTWHTTSRQSRGYGATWEKLRRLVLIRDRGLCQCDQCQTDKRLTLATEVDHIKPKSKGGTDDLDNLRAVSHDCHVRLTAEQQGKRPRVTTGLDGWPA